MLGLVQVPSTSEAVDGKGVYTVFDIHLNGNYHGSARYSQLLTFHQELKSKFEMKTVEEFPSKHWFSSLSAEQLYARRVGIERYLHSLAQDKAIGVSPELKEFFIAMQRACCDIPEDSSSSEVNLEVFLVNGKSTSVQVDPFYRTDQVLEAVSSQIQLKLDLTYYFNLFLEKQDGEEQTWTVVRPLTNFECPHVSLQTLNKTSPHRISIRKSFWDKAFLAEILADRVGKNLLYIECLWEVSSAHWEIPSHILKKLTSLQKKSQKKEYVELVGSLPQFGFVQLDGFVLDHPEELDSVSVRVGKLEMVTYVSETGKGQASSKPTELKKLETYPLTKIRSWKVGDKWNTPSPSWKAPWLKFFFQVSGSDFLPVIMQGPQAIFLSNCLHAIVDELLRLRRSEDIHRPTGSAIERQLYELPKVVFYESPEVLQDRREGKDLEKEQEQTDSADTATPTTPPPPTQTTPTSDTPTTDSSSQESSSTKHVTPANGASAATPTSDSKSFPEYSSSKSSKRSSSDQPAILTKAKQQVLALMKRDSTTPAETENATFVFGTDEDL